MPGTNTVIVDSDALIASINTTDANHERSVKISQYIIQNNLEMFVPYAIILEAATALARSRINRPDLSKKLLNDYSLTEEKPSVETEVARMVSELFSTNTSRKNTPFDHYLLALAKKNGIRYIFSFDSFYKKQGLTPVEELLKK